MIPCKCPNCGAAYELDAQHVGQKLRCDACERAFTLVDAAGRTAPFEEPRAVTARAAVSRGPAAPEPAAAPAPAGPTAPRVTAPRPRRESGERTLSPVTIVLVLLALAALALSRLLGPAAGARRAGLAPSPPLATGAVARVEAPAPPPAAREASPPDAAATNTTNAAPPDADAPAEPTPAPVTLKPEDIQPGVMEEDFALDPALRPGYIEKTDSPAVGAAQGEWRAKPDRLTAFLKVLEREKYACTRDVRQAFLELRRAEARDALQWLKKPLPEAFLRWVDKDAEVSASVYGVRARPENVLLALYALQLDVGEDTVRHFPQLALAAALLRAKEGPAADIAPRAPVKLVIPPCPLKPVDTRDPQRALDVNDHIINFLNEDYRLVKTEGGRKPRNPHHEGDACVQAFRFEKGLPPEPEGLIASDVIKDDALKDLLAQYLKSKGCPLDIPHGELESQATYTNFEIFHKAYVAKGLLPADREPLPSTAERLLFLARNAEHAPFPLKKAPWPVLTLLFEVSLPLREAEEIWTAYRKDKRFVTYGNYVGPIAQNAIHLAASDLRPFPFACRNRSWQAMLKNGGVCGTMAALAVGTYNTLGIPAVTAGQPGHCALIRYRVSGRVYSADIEQSVTGGPAETTPHAGWPLGEPPYGAPHLYVYRECAAKAMNCGFDDYLDACMMHAIYRLVPPDVRERHGFELLRNGLELNPYAIALVDAASEIGSALQHAELYRWFDAHVAAGHKAGMGLSEVYRDKVARVAFGRIAALPVGDDRDAAEAIARVLGKLRFDPGELELLDALERTTLAYQAKAQGLRDFLAGMTQAFTAHFESSKQRHPALCQAMARRLRYVAALVPDAAERKQWLERLAKRKHNNEDYSAFGRLQVDRLDKNGKPANYQPGLGGLTLREPGRQPVGVHFVLSSGVDGYEALRDRDNAAAGGGTGKPSDKAESIAFARATLRDDVSDAIDELLGQPRKPLQGLSALLAGEALADRKAAAEIVAFLDKTRFEAAGSTLRLRYELAAMGEAKFLAEELDAYKKYVAPTGRNELESRRMAARIEAVAGLLAEGPAKRAWLERMRAVIRSKETYRSRWRLQDKDEYGHALPPAEREKLVSCPQETFRDETADALDKLLGGGATSQDA